MEVGFSYGFLSPTLKEQAEKQGFTFNEKDAELLEKLRESLNWVRMHSLLTESQSDAAYKKLQKKVVKKLKPLPKEVAHD